MHIADCRQAMALITDNADDLGLILLDLNMPRKDGREALKEIKSHPDLRTIPVVLSYCELLSRCSPGAVLVTSTRGGRG